jgi:hypothetical protein
MADYQAVKDALAKGADPAMLCTTCPWDRNCVNPPAMTSAEVEQRMKEESAKDEAKIKANPSGGGMPVGTLMAALVYGGKDTAVQACPVLGIRLRTGDGRKIAETVRGLMQGWED